MFQSVAASMSNTSPLRTSPLTPKTINDSNINSMDLEMMRKVIKNDDNIYILGSCE